MFKDKCKSRILVLVLTLVNMQSCFTVKGSLETGHRVEAICNIIDQVTKTPYINSLKREVGNFDEHKN